MTSVDASWRERVLVWTPLHEDGRTTRDVLTRQGFEVDSCDGVQTLCGALHDAGAAVVAEEALTLSAVESLGTALADQAPWSDFPLVLFTTRREGSRHYEPLMSGQHAGNVTVLERPVSLSSFLSAIRVALRSRQRQFQMRDLLEASDHRQQALAEADRQKDEFLAMLGHELRNPLTAIHSGIQVMERGGGNRTAETLPLLRHQVDHMVRLVNDLLDVSRVTRGKIELRQDAIALGDVLAHAVETVRPAIAEREQELRLVPPPRDVMVKGDSTRLVQVFANLLSNASQYTSRKGLVEVTTEKGPELVVVRVRDTGRGIEPEALAHIFEAFVQPGRHAGSASAGLGLGLTLVRQLVEMHGGKVSAHSEGADQGTTMTVRLPRVAPGEEHERSPVPETPHGARAASRILVVEDNEAAARNVAELLRMQGYDVRAVGDGPGALELARSFRPDVVLLDIGLPGMDGCDVARALRREHGDAPWIVALTGYGDAPSRRRILDAGADRHVVKPIDLDTLDAVLVGR